MRFSSKTVLALLLAAIPTSTVNAVLYGDEQFLDVEGGNFWAFYNSGIVVINPQTCQIEMTINEDHTGSALPTSWNDGVYQEYKNEDTGEYEGYLLVDSREDKTNEAGETVSSIVAISTTKKEVVDTIEAGPRIVHSYAVYTQNEFWAHSDGDGHFYVVNLADLSTHTHKVSAKVNTAHHGKLLWDEDPEHLNNRGFATSTGEAVLFELDLKTKQQTRAYDYSSNISFGCIGLHAIAYSSQNQHVYTECVAGGGILEFDVSNGDIQFVKQHTQATGALYETPDGSYVVATNKGGNKLHVFKPNGTGQASSVEFDVDVPGHPSTVSFLQQSDTPGDYVACMPLTENLNQNQRDGTGNIKCDYYTQCTGAVTETDVSHGICYHDTTTDRLVRQTTVVQNMPNCRRCENSANFVDGECICTPDCGYCDSSPDHSDEQSGYVCVDLGDVVMGITTSGTVIPDMGGVHQGRGYGGSAECSFGRTYRNHKRGARKFDASVANIPTDSIQILNMETQRKHCEVELPAAPSRVLYAPAKPVGDGLGTSGAVSTDGGRMMMMGVATMTALIMAFLI